MAWPNPQPAGALALPLYNLARLISMSATFRAAAGVDPGGDDDALFDLLAVQPTTRRRIYFGEAQSGTLQNLHGRQLAVIGADRFSTPLEFFADGSPEAFRTQGSLSLILYGQDLYPDDLDRSYIAFLNYVAGIFSDIAAIEDLDSFLKIGDVTSDRPAARSRTSEEAGHANAVWWGGMYTIEWSS